MFEIITESENPKTSVVALFDVLTSEFTNDEHLTILTRCLEARYDFKYDFDFIGDLISRFLATVGEKPDTTKSHKPLKESLNEKELN